MVIETERFLLREFLIDDAKDLYLLNSDPDVLKYTGDLPFVDIPDAENFIQSYDQYQLYGLGRWAVIIKNSGKFMGWCGIKYSPNLDEHDIGFRLFKSEWNKGYATETAKACIKYGFSILNLNRIVGRARIENKSSIKVLEKCGLTFFKNIDFDEESGFMYHIEK